MKNNIHLEKVTWDNYYKVIKLRVSKEQKSFVANNKTSLAHAFLTSSKGCPVYAFAIYNNKKVVGFIQLVYDNDWTGYERDNWLSSEDFKQINAFCELYEYQLKKSKKDKVFISKTLTNKKLSIRDDQNKEKNRILAEGEIIEPLIDMGIFTKEGKVVTSMYDKFKQINRFIEFVDDIVEEFDENKTIRIIDFGCGKSYLTFAIHYYLTEVKKFKVDIVGLDLKENVIKEIQKEI